MGAVAGGRRHHKARAGSVKRSAWTCLLTNASIEISGEDTRKERLASKVSGVLATAAGGRGHLDRGGLQERQQWQVRQADKGRHEEDKRWEGIGAAGWGSSSRWACVAPESSCLRPQEAAGLLRGAWMKRGYRRLAARPSALTLEIAQSDILVPEALAEVLDEADTAQETGRATGRDTASTAAFEGDEGSPGASPAIGAGVGNHTESAASAEMAWKEAALSVDTEEAEDEAAVAEAGPGADVGAVAVSVSKPPRSGDRPSLTCLICLGDPL